jgi:signal transduction histidine kinase
VDALYQRAVLSAYGILFLIVVAISLLILRHARIINYAGLYDELRKALVAKTEFMHMTAHEFRAPLTSMRGYASMIAEKPNGTDIALYAKRIEDTSMYMISLVSDLLEVAALEAKSVTLAHERFNVASVIERVIAALEPLATEHALSLGMEGVDSSLAIVGDERRFEQILINIVSNALKYTKEGSVKLTAHKNRDLVEVRIEDTGIGMTSEDRDRLFSPYFRTEEGAKSGVVGTGLGLWITKQFIERMGGHVSVESIHGVGTHVVLSFPAA